MIGSGLKKLAQEKGMQVAKGVAYGSLDGFAATLSEGSGYKQIVFTTRFTDPARKMELQDLLNSVDLGKTYRVANLQLLPNAIWVTFQDTIGTMKKITAFLQWFTPLLRQYGATPYNVCVECGCGITAGKWALINGVAYHFHDACAEKAAREVAGSNTRRAESEGSYGMGLIGALLGAALGAVVWAIVLNMGYVAAIVGLLIAWLAEKGYTLLKGKQGKAKVAILIVAIIFGVLLGTFMADAFTLMGMINNGELPGATLGDIPSTILVLLMESEEYCQTTVQNVLMGLLFAALGVFGTLRQMGKEVADETYVELK